MNLDLFKHSGEKTNDAKANIHATGKGMEDMEKKNVSKSSFVVVRFCQEMKQSKTTRIGRICLHTPKETTRPPWMSRPWPVKLYFVCFFKLPWDLAK